MAIDTRLVTVCGVLATRRLHIKYSTPPQIPATIFHGYMSNDINVYIVKKQAVPAH
jgi:hypothetical protein